MIDTAVGKTPLLQVKDPMIDFLRFDSRRKCDKKTDKSSGS